MKNHLAGLPDSSIFESIKKDLAAGGSMEPYLHQIPEALEVLGHPDGMLRDRLG